MTMLYHETMPEDLQRMEATGKWCSMAKADGDNFQAIWETSKKSGKKVVRLINRHENEYTRQFPEIVAGLGVKQDVNCVLNGEIAYWNEEKQIYDFNLFRGRQGLQKDRDIMRRRLKYPCKLYVFDLIEYNGEKMANNPYYTFERRYRLLKQIVINNNVTELLPIRTDIQEHFREECEAGREGIMVKRLDNIYIDKRTRSVLKCKNWKFENVKFTGFEDNNAGITLTNDTDRVLCAGKKAEYVRALIMQLGYVDCNIRHLQGRSEETNKMREPSFKGVADENGLITEIMESD